MKVTITIYGIVTVSNPNNQITVQKHYFAMEEERNEMLQFFIADNDCECYTFEYEEEVEV